MAQRNSGYERRGLEHYPTPDWVIEALAEHVDFRDCVVWEPACGDMQMVRAIRREGAQVIASDIHEYPGADPDFLFDFATPGRAAPAAGYFNIICTNPPYGPRCTLAETFIARGLERLAPGGMLFLLLPCDFNSAKTRAHLFSENPHYVGRIVLTRRIKWFEPKGPNGETIRGPSPSQNHAWFCWCRSPMRSQPLPFELFAPMAEEDVAA